MGPPRLVCMHSHVPFHNQIILCSSLLFLVLCSLTFYPLALICSRVHEDPSFWCLTSLPSCFYICSFFFLLYGSPFFPHSHFFPSSSDGLPSCASFELFTVPRLPLHFSSGISVHWQTSSPFPDAQIAVLPLFTSFFLPRWPSFFLFFFFLVLLQCLHSSDWLLYFSLQAITTHTIP